MFLKNARPSSASHCPSSLACNLVRHRDVGMQIRIAGAGITVGERGRDQSVHLDLGDAALAAAGVGRVLLQPADRVCDGVVVGLLDDLRDLAGRDRPEGGHALDRGEGQVVAGHRGGGLPRDSGQMTRQLAGIDRVPAVGFGEHPGRDVAADLSADLSRNRCVGLQRPFEVVLAERAGRAAVEHVHLLVNPVRIAQPAGRVDLGRVLARSPGCLLDGVGVRMPALAEQRPHLRLGDIPGHRKISQAGEAGAQPDAGSLALLAVIGREVAVPPMRGIRRRHLSGQIRIPIARGQLVQAHHDQTVA